MLASTQIYGLEAFPCGMNFYLVQIWTKLTYSGVSTSIKAHNFVWLLRGTLSISVASTPQLDLFPKTWYSERFPPGSRGYIWFIN